MAVQAGEGREKRFLTQPIAPLPLFGVAQKLSNGHFATIILIAMFAMMITAVSYGLMAAIYPAAGSANTAFTDRP